MLNHAHKVALISVRSRHTMETRMLNHRSESPKKILVIDNQMRITYGQEAFSLLYQIHKDMIDDEV